MGKLSFKKLVKQWTKVKPVLLTKTGISDLIEPFENFDRSTLTYQQVGKFQTLIGTTLQSISEKMKDDRIKKYEAVVEWLDDLYKAIGDEGIELARIKKHVATLKKHFEPLSGLLKDIRNTPILIEKATQFKQHAEKVTEAIQDIRKICPLYLDSTVEKSAERLEKGIGDWLKLTDSPKLLNVRIDQGETVELRLLEAIENLGLELKGDLKLLKQELSDLLA